MDFRSRLRALRIIGGAALPSADSDAHQARHACPYCDAVALSLHEPDAHAYTRRHGSSPDTDAGTGLDTVVRGDDLLRPAGPSMHARGADDQRARWYEGQGICGGEWWWSRPCGSGADAYTMRRKR